MGVVLAVAPTEAASGASSLGAESSEIMIPLAAENPAPEIEAVAAAAVTASPEEGGEPAAKGPDTQTAQAVSAESAEPSAAAVAVAEAAPVIEPTPAAPVVASLAPSLPQPPAIVAYASPRPERSVDRAEVDRLISHYSNVYEVPEPLVRRVVKRESNFRPSAYNKGHWGLMQIKHATARGMGYKGTAEGLLDAETNLRYAVKYLRGAYMVAGGDHDQAVRFYARGYYFDAKRAGMLEATGLGRDRVRKRRPG